ncbi:hypothetical protein HDU76_008647 [Blyttiomyces sp. JEL0837]|nr:hypothetical protein HDU76_008647 [Blyttiomyces sp. JEL0837]
MTKGLVVLVGAGPGTGAAVARCFAKNGYSLALLARSQNSLDELTNSINKTGGVAKAFQCDVTSEESVINAFSSISSSFPGSKVKAGIFNAAGFVMKPFLETSRATMDQHLAFVGGAFSFSQQLIKAIQQHDEGGSLIFSGATAALRGAPNFSVLAAYKSGIRAMSQSIAKEFGPQGIHVAHVVLDGILDTEGVTKMMGPGKPDTRVSLDEIAKAYVYLHEQQKSCWTHELDLRPFSEKF